ncbi:hypothetical protein GCM10010169_21310 [Micromonospora fulviviridis]|nr:hypothetical protein GCM10010169_21310 [Micromonospora fulviviridis]
MTSLIERMMQVLINPHPARAARSQTAAAVLAEAGPETEQRDGGGPGAVARWPGDAVGTGR